jgi:glutamate/tyrosine decarboxylase-like PLP-dependent enzyme
LVNGIAMSDQTAVFNRATDHARRYLAGISDRPVRATATAAELRQALGADAPLPRQGESAEAVIDRLAAAAATGTVATQGPRYFGFVVGGSLPVANAADWLVSIWDQNAGVFVLSPLISVVEEAAASWVRDLAGVPASWSVGFVTGCQMASFTALAAARQHLLANAGWDVGARGLFGAPPIDVVVSDESHYTIFNALRLLGLGAERVRRIPTDEQGRMRPDALADALKGGTGPCIVCAQSGNVNSGAFDPLEAIADAASARGAWLHVDGAFGFWAAASPARRHLVAGIHRADSIATDAHKWLNVPYDCGIVLTAHQASHRRAMTQSAAYIIDSATERNPHEFVPEESRRGRAVTVYAALRALGRDGLADLVERNCRQAARMADRLRAHPRMTILNDVVLNQVLVRISGDGGDADAVTRDVIARVQADGTCWLGGTTWHGMGAMRISISNWSTTDADIDRAAAAIIAACGAS